AQARNGLRKPPRRRDARIAHVILPSAKNTLRVDEKAPALDPYKILPARVELARVFQIPNKPLANVRTDARSRSQRSVNLPIRALYEEPALSLELVIVAKP